MKFSATEALLCVLISASTVAAADTKSTTPRTAIITTAGQIIKKLAIQQPSNISSTDIITDIRTPPRVKQMIKKVEQKPDLKTENSHPGLAEPVVEDLEALEESMKKLNFYKIEKSTTDKGLSTWILLSGQGVTSLTTAAPPLKPVQTVSNRNSSVITNANGSVKPLFKKRPAPSTKSTTMAKVSTPTQTKATTTIPTVTSSIHTERPSKLAQVKTPQMFTRNSNNRKNITEKITQDSKRNSTNDTKKTDVELVKITTPNKSTTVQLSSTTELAPELKEGDLELPSSTTNPKKSRRPGNKKKKDKNRRKRPSSAENKIAPQNKTKISNKISQKVKPISTQIYNYLAREVMPTVGVGLVGLVVTAGLASYFLYPFGGLRRSYDIDRRDRDPYYYDNSKVALDYDSGIAEEEAIGKVIAGMPFSSTNFGNNYHQKTSRNTYNNNRYRHVDSTSYSKPITTSESIQLRPNRDQYQDDENYIYDTHYSGEINKNDPITYNKNVMTQNIEEPYNTGQQFVVGNVPKEVIEEITPAAVPEHGPRSLRSRKRRDIDAMNEINVDETPQKQEKVKDKRPVVEKNHYVNTKVNDTNITKAPTLKEHVYNFMDVLKDIFTTKLKAVVEMLQSQTKTFSRYLNSMHDSLRKLNNDKHDKKA